MDYIRLINRFWQLNDIEPFTAAEVTLYFFLLNEANRRFWPGKLHCSSAYVCCSTSLNKSTLVRAREGLSARGLIEYTAGVQNSAKPVYVLAGCASDDKGEEMEEVEEVKVEAKTSVQKAAPCRKESLGVLERRLLADEAWQADVSVMLVREGLPRTNLRESLSYYFSYLRACRVERKTDADCRAHFVNKLRTDLGKQRNVNNLNIRNHGNNRNRLKITAKSAADYECSF